MEQHVDTGARIVDRGFQHYDGTRLGAPHLLWAMIRATLARGMGIKRPLIAKVIPMLLVVGANLPVVVVLAAQLLNSGANASIPGYVELGTQTNVFLYLLFSAVVGPDLLCPDRRQRVITLYFTAPVTRAQYILARLCGMAVLLLLLTLMPLVALFVGDALLATSAADYVRDHLDLLGRLLLTGVVLAGFYACLALVVASFSDRRVYAGGAFIGLLLVTGLLGSILGLGIEFGGHQYFILSDLLNLGPRTARWILGRSPLTPDGNATAQAALGISGWAYVVSMAVVVVVALALLLRRYQKLAG